MAWELKLSPLMNYFWLHTKTTIALIFLFISGITGISHADCDPFIKKLKTNYLEKISLCDIQSRYLKAIGELKKRGISNPHFLGNIFATRFIRVTDWTNHLKKYGDSPFSAYLVYGPSHLVFSDWLNASQFVFASASTQPFGFSHRSNEEVLAWLKQIHAISMDYTKKHNHLPRFCVGKFRQVPEIIPITKQDNAYLISDIRAIVKSPFLSARTGRPLMTFYPRPCKNSGSHYAPLNSASHYFRVNQIGKTSEAKSCGELIMPSPNEVEEQMNFWALYFKNGLRLLKEEPDSTDIVAFAAYLQQWVSVIHPFIDGNGRVSRLLMDYVFQSANLPAPILDNVDRDFFSTPSEWAQMVGRGLINSIERLEACANDETLVGCHEVAHLTLAREKTN